ncbi:SDR family NAD(P)-dependent oxidoreductase [Spirosoma arcticum]
MRFQQVIRVNPDGPCLVTKALLTPIKQSSAGRIINLSSSLVFVPPPTRSGPLRVS